METTISENIKLFENEMPIVAGMLKTFTKWPIVGLLLYYFSIFKLSAITTFVYIFVDEKLCLLNLLDSVLIYLL
jgi:hypothetical protein